MATKTLNTRISLRYDQFSAWNTVNPVLLKGEFAIANAPASAGSGMTEPAVLIKVGDGTSHYNDLPYITAKAGDVLEACKTEAALKTFINGVIADAGLTDNSTFKDLQDAVALLNDDATKVGSVANSIKTAIEALDFTDTAVDHQFITSVSEADGVISVTRAQPEIADVNGLQAALNAKQDNLVFMTTYNKDTNKVATATDLQKVADDASAEIANKISSAYKAAGTVANVAALPAASAATLGFVYNLTAADTTTADFVEGAGKAIPEGANIVVVEIPGANEGDPSTYKFDVLSGMVDLSDYAKTTEVTTAITNAVEALDYTDTAVDHEFVSEVQEVDGIISVVRKALVAADIPALTSDKITDITTKIQTVLKDSLTKPAAPADPDNPTEEETAAQNLYNQILNKVTKIVNEALTGTGADSTALATTIETIVKDGILDSTTPNALNTAVNNLIDAKINDLDVVDDGQTGVVTKVIQDNGRIAVTKKAISDVDGFDEAVAGGVENILTPADPDNPGTVYNTLVESITNAITKEIEKVPATGETNDLADAIKKAVDDALKDIGDSSADPAVPASALNTTVNNMIDSKINKLDVTDTAVDGQFVTAVSQEDGKVVVTRAAIKLSEITQEAGDDQVIWDCGSASI